jgi:hypothetical protein
MNNEYSYYGRHHAAAGRLMHAAAAGTKIK